MSDIIGIDGSFGSGGGQVLRTSTALSALTEKPIRIFNIRKGRKKGGLQTQHLEGLKAVAKLCNAEIKGAVLGSSEIEFYPKKIINKPLEIKIATAGSIGLLFQSLQLPASYTDKELEIKIIGGSTFSAWCPPIPYAQNILLPILNKIGYKAEIEILKHGFYPTGGACINITVYPCKAFKSLKLIEQGKLKSIKGISIASEFLKKSEVAERQAESAENIIKEIGIEPEIKIEYVKSTCPGSGIVLWCEFENAILGSDSIGERGKPAESVGEEAANDLIKSIESKKALDKHMADQILNFIALTEGSQISVEEITDHCRTNIWVVEKFLPVLFEIDEENKIIKCRAD